MSSSSSFERISDDSDVHDDPDLSFVEDHLPEPESSKNLPQVEQKPKGSSVLEFLFIFLSEVVFFICLTFILSAIALSPSEAKHISIKPPVAVNTTPFNQIISGLDEIKLKQLETVKMEQKLVDQHKKYAKIKEVNGCYDFPEYLWDKWTPDPTRFEGVAHLLHQTGLNGTALEKFIYTNKYKITRVDKNKNTYHPEADAAFTPLTTHPHYRSYTGCYKIKNGDMIIDFTLTSDHETLKMTLVYYIPISDII